MEKLAKPVSSHGEQITEGVAQMTWTAASDANGIQAGQFRDFPISVQIPEGAGDALTFKALQTYEDGEVVRWIGAPDSDEPAPQVTVSHGEGGHGEAAADGDSDDGSGGDGLAIVALIVGALGLLAGGLALVRSRAS